jgi:hypothetical protein
VEGNLVLLKWARTTRPPCPWTPRTRWEAAGFILDAVNNNQLSVVKWLLRIGAVRGTRWRNIAVKKWPGEFAPRHLRGRDDSFDEE